jgi:hypothetical protein
VAPYIENCIIIIGINLGELFRGGELLLNLRVFEKFANVVWERLKVRFQQLHIDNLVFELNTHLDAIFIHRRIGARRRGEIDDKMRREDVVRMSGFRKVPSLIKRG